MNFAVAPLFHRGRKNGRASALPFFYMVSQFSRFSVLSGSKKCMTFPSKVM